jgi:hypothetical protein
MTDVPVQQLGARTGEQYLDGLRRGGREIWLRGEKVESPLDHPELRGAALSMARVFDAQHEHADEMLVPSPDGGEHLVNVTHLVPRTREDLERRRRAFEIVASLSGGTMGRTPDYLNVTFACFAGRSDVWARPRQRGARREPRRLPGAHARPRPVDDARADEPDGGPLQARGRAGHGPGLAPQGLRDGRPHRRARRADARDAVALRRRPARLPRVRHPPAGRPLRAELRGPDRHAGPEVHLPRLVRQGARPYDYP